MLWGGRERENTTQIAERRASALRQSELREEYITKKNIKESTNGNLYSNILSHVPILITGGNPWQQMENIVIHM